ncbi:MAG: class I SAM-dependent RNA methyltransferase [Chitinophagales bacterium]|nr:class I SAM-dependent RNA methyltransferase [Chitinophagales bacterium]
MTESTFPIVVKTLFGLEEVLAQEIEELCGVSPEILNRAVSFDGDMEMVFKCNLHLRTALRVVLPIRTIRAYNYKQYIRKIKSVDWSSIFHLDQTFSIHATTHSEVFRHSKYVALKAKDAIVDQFREKFDKRPSVDTENPDVQIYIHISDKDCTLSLDSSGESLDKRGYRLEMNAAPINEVLAAGIIKLTGWDHQTNFCDPMCGSGTFPIEAAMLTANIPAGFNRSFAFEKWKDLDRECWKRVKNEAVKNVNMPANNAIYAFDIDEESVQIAKENAKRAGVKDLINFKTEDLFESESNLSDTLLILNPPYGKRINPDELIGFYKSIGTALKHHFNGCTAWIISANLEALKFIGLKASKKIKLFNGPLECRLQRYDLFKGKRKDFKLAKGKEEQN